jgi:ATP-dependent RNA helicase DeaD
VGRAGREGVAITVVEPRDQTMLRNIERVTGQKFEMLRVPTAADLKACRLERTKAAIRTAIAEGGLDEFREIIASLGTEFDATAVALAAFKLAHIAEVGDTEDGEDIVVATPEPTRTESRARGKNVRSPGPRLARLFINAGREAGVSPKDLVGAIANEAGLPGRDIRGIEITERFSLVEIPEDYAEHVIESLNGARLRGRRINVRRDRQDEGGR